MAQRMWSRTAAGAAWVAGGLAAASLILIAAQFRTMVAQAAWNSDSLMPWVMAESGTAASDRVGGQYAFPTILWFNELTLWVPGHRVLWTLAPIVVWIAIVLGVALPVARLAGRAAGVLAAVILVCACPPVMRTYLWTDFHTPTFLAGVVIAAWLAALVIDARLRRPLPLIIGGVLIGAFAGSQLVDPLLWAAGVGPLVAAAVAWRLVERTPDVTRALLGLGLLIVVAVAAALATEAIMHATHFRTDSSGMRVVVSPGHVREQASLLAQMVWHMGNGALVVSAWGPVRGGLALLAAGAMTLAALTPVALGVRSIVALARRRPLGALETVWTVFWGAVVVLLAAAVLFTTSATNLDSFRYIVGILFAAAATVPMLLRWAAPVRTIALAGVAVYLVAGLVGLTDREITRWYADNDRSLANVERFAREHGVTQGYGEYWYAAPVTWNSHERVTLRPVVSCSPSTTAICRPPLAVDYAWYRPRTGRMMLLWPAAAPLPQGLPEPIAQADVGPMAGGPTVTAYAFDRDILPGIGPPPDW